MEITEAQKTRIREQATLHIPDRAINPVLPPLGNAQVDAIGDVPVGKEYLDIDLIGVTVEQPGGRVMFALSSVGELPNNISDLSYVFLLDLDNDPSSGGSPGDIGIPTALAGVDLIVAVEIDVVSGVVQATPNVKKFDASLGSFVGVASPGIIATVLPTKLGLIPADPEAGEPSINEVQLGQIISAEIPGAVVGSTSTVFRLEALAQHSTSTVDRAAARISFELPVFPSCEVMPAAATLGATVSVDAEGLEPDATASVILGGHMVATGSVDDGGRAAIAFTVPEAVSTGL